MADDIKFVIGVDDRDLVKAQKEQIKFQRNLVTIEKAYRKGDITAARYNAELAKQAKQLQTLGGNYRTANSEVRKFAYQMRQADDATLAQTEAMAFAGKRVNRLGVGLQQAGYQVGDFAVQVQGGTNVMVALGQQGAQLAGIFGPAGAIAGAGLAITTAFLAPLVQANKAAKEAASGADSFAASLKNARQELQGMNLELEVLNSGFRNAFEFTLSTAVDKAKDKLDEALTALKTAEELAMATATAGGISIDVLFGLSAKKVATAKDAVELATLELASAKLLAKQAERRGRDESIVNQLVKARVILREAEKKATEKFLEAQGKIAEQERIVGASLNDSLGVLKYMKAGFKAAEIQALQLSGVDLTANISSGAKAAVNLARNLGISYDTAVKLRELEATGDSGRGAGYEALSQELQLRNATGMGFVGNKGKTKTASGGGSKADPLAELRKRITLEEALFKKTEAQQQVMQALGVDYEKVYGKEATDQIIGRINKIKELQKEEDKLADIAQNIGSSFETAFTSMVDGTSSVKDAFRDMARDIVAHLFKVLVIQRAINAFGGALSGSSNAAVASIGTELQNYDGGGYTGSGPRSGGMDGRGGRLAMIHPQETIIDHTKANSGVGEQIVINQSFNFQANGDDSVKKLIAQAAPQIANMTQKQIVDSRKRGGAMKSAFG